MLQAVAQDEVHALVKAGVKLKDAALLKAARVLSQHQDAAHQAKFAPAVPDLLELAQVSCAHSAVL